MKTTICFFLRLRLERGYFGGSGLGLDFRIKGFSFSGVYGHCAGLGFRGFRVLGFRV